MNYQRDGVEDYRFTVAFDRVRHRIVWYGARETVCGKKRPKSEIGSPLPRSYDSDCSGCFAQGSLL